MLNNFKENLINKEIGAILELSLKAKDMVKVRVSNHLLDMVVNKVEVLEVKVKDRALVIKEDMDKEDTDKGKEVKDLEIKEVMADKEAMEVKEDMEVVMEIKVQQEHSVEEALKTVIPTNNHLTSKILHQT